MGKTLRPLLTIITATLNSSLTIKATLESLHKSVLKHQLASYVKHLVLDGNSTDDTLKLVKVLSPTSNIHVCKTKGLYNALNEGVSLADTPYLTFLHSDDELEENYLYYLITAIDEISNPGKVFVGTVSFIDKKGTELFRRYPPYYFERIQKKINLILHPNAFYPTRLMRQFPFRQELFGRASDQHQILEMMRVAKYVRIPKAVYKFRMSENSTTLAGIKTNTKKNALFARMYIHLFENRKIHRLVMKLHGKSYWRL